MTSSRSSTTQGGGMGHAIDVLSLACTCMCRNVKGRPYTTLEAVEEVLRSGLRTARRREVGSRGSGRRTNRWT
jgi:hypothetical protein